MANEHDAQALLEFLLDKAQRCGATAADALLVRGRSSKVRVRLGEVETVKQSRSNGVGLRVFIGDRSAVTSSSDLDRATLGPLVERICRAAGVTAQDEVAGLPDAALFEDEPRSDLALFDDAVADLAIEGGIELARRAEASAQGADERITNSEGAEAAWGTSETHLACSHGVYRHHRHTSASLWTAPVADHSGGMERDYWYTSARHLSDMDAPEAVGKTAASRVVRRLGARKPDTCRVPVVFEQPIASRLLGSLAGAVNGSSIYRQTSFLVGKLGETIAHPSVTIIDDAGIERGAGSKPFDGEGLATRATTIVEGGVLRSYLLDSYSARKLGLETTRNASRGLSGTPQAAATNFWMAPGEHTLESLIAGIERGLLVTETFGFGVNAITGDYSQGAVGVWIEDGALAYPVHEFTVASTLQTIFGSLDAIADDRDPRLAVSAPSFRVPEMTVAGS